MADDLPEELAYRLKIWWDPIWPILDKAGLAEQQDIMVAAIDAQVQIHTIQANMLNQIKQHVQKAKPKR